MVDIEVKLMDTQLQADLETMLFRALMDTLGWHNLPVDEEYLLQRAGSWAAEIVEKVEGTCERSKR